MKRIISVVLAVSMTASFLTGCIGGQNTGRTRTERERRHDITAESVEGTGVGNISDTIEAESDGEMIFDTAEAGVEPETDTWTGDERSTNRCKIRPHTAAGARAAHPAMTVRRRFYKG